jgi:hypothetical protein
MKDRIKSWRELILPSWKYYNSGIEEHAAGGNLHIVLDDGNLETEHVEWCLREATKRGDAPGTALAELLLRATLTQRAKLQANYSLYCYEAPKPGGENG